MKHFFLSFLMIGTICACDKSHDDNGSKGGSSVPKVDNPTTAAIPGAWMDEQYRSAYISANSQHPTDACTILVKREGSRTSMTTPGSYTLIGEDGSFKDCKTDGGVGSHGEATPITFQCEPQPISVDPNTGVLQGLGPNCNAQFSANDTRAVMAGACNGTAQELGMMRVTKEGFENLIRVAKDCLINAR